MSDEESDMKTLSSQVDMPYPEVMVRLGSEIGGNEYIVSAILQ